MVCLQPQLVHPKIEGQTRLYLNELQSLEETRQWLAATGAHQYMAN